MKAGSCYTNIGTFFVDDFFASLARIAQEKYNKFNRNHINVAVDRDSIFYQKYVFTHFVSNCFKITSPL